MNNYYQPKVYENLTDATVALKDCIYKGRIKVNFTGIVYQYNESYITNTTIIGLGLDNGRSIPVFCKKEINIKLKEQNIHKGSYITVKGFISCYQKSTRTPYLQITAYDADVIGKSEFNPYPVNTNPKTIKKLNKIGIIASENSDGLDDFIDYLPKKFKEAFYLYCDEKYTQIEGDEGINNIIKIINEFNTKAEEDRPDVICIVRGGGDKYALSYVFDNPALCEAVIASQIPVLTGIGHTGDKLQIENVADFPFFNTKRQIANTPTSLGKLISNIYYSLKAQANPKTNTTASEIPKIETTSKSTRPIFENSFLSGVIIILLIYIWLFT